MTTRPDLRPKPEFVIRGVTVVKRDGLIVQAMRIRGADLIYRAHLIRPNRVPSSEWPSTAHALSEASR